MTRPTCITPDCNNLCQNTRSKANPVWRKTCSSCHKKSYQGKWSIERIKRTRAKHIECQQKWRKANPDKVKEATAKAKMKTYSGFEELTKYKCRTYFYNDGKKNLVNYYETLEDMRIDLIDMVNENIKKNNGVVRCEVDNILLNHDCLSMQQISFDRIDNTKGHFRENLRIVAEPYNTMTKDKFSVNQYREHIKLIIEAAA